MKNRTNHQPLTTLLALITLLSLLFVNISPLYAQRSIFRSIGDKQGQAPGDKQQTTEKKQDTSRPLLDPKSLLGDRPKTLAQSIQIPAEYGRISETHEGNPKPLIIHIQDVHVHYEAQKNLANILDKLVKENGLQLILVEGGSGDTSLSFLRAEATKEKRLEVAEKYLKLGKISGEEYLDIISDNPISLWGIEKEGLYDKNLDIFFKVDAMKGKALGASQGLKKIVEALKTNIYSQAIKELEQKKHDYEEGKVQAVDYYQYLGGFSQSQNIDLSRYPNFQNFLTASLLEKQIDFQKVDGQHQALIGKLTQVLSKEDLTLLAEKGLKYKLNEAGPSDYYGFLRDILGKSDPVPGTHQDLDRYIDYVILYADRDHVELFREGKILEKEIKGKLYTSGDERTLSEISDKLDLLFNFLELNLSPDDLKAYQADRKGFLVKGWKPFLLEKMDQYQLSLVFPMEISAIDDHWGLLESFYEFGLERDSALVENALTKMNDEKVDLAVLIAGGFHTEQITRLLREQNYSYLVVAPKITQASDLGLYHKILKEKAKPETPADENLRQVPAIERGIAGDFTREAQDGAGKEARELARIIRKLKRLSQHVDLNSKKAEENVEEAKALGERLDRIFSGTSDPVGQKIAALAKELKQMDIGILRLYTGGHFETRVGQLTDLLNQFAQGGTTARDGAYKILGEPALVFGLRDAAEIGDGVVFDVRGGSPIRIGKGAKILGNSYLKDASVGENAVVESSLVDMVIVGNGAHVSNSVLRSTSKVEEWVFDKEKKYRASGSMTQIGKGARVRMATLINTKVGEGTEIEGGAYTNSEIGKQNRLSHVKMTLVHTEHDVTLLAPPQLPSEVSEAWLGYGFYADQQAFIDSVVHTNEIVSLRFNPRTGRIESFKQFDLPALSFIGRGVVYSSYSGNLDATKPHRNRLFESHFFNPDKTLAPPIRIQGIDGTESSAHGYLLVDPLSILGPFLRWIALPGGRPSSDPFQLALYTDLTHTMPFSVIGFPLEKGKGLDDWGLALPGAVKYGLRRNEVNIPFLFTYSPDTIFQWMRRLAERLPAEEKAKYDDLVLEMLETGRALVQRELYNERQKFHEDQDQKRIAQLEKWVNAYTLHIESGAWHFQEGQPVGWRFEQEWIHDALDLRRLAREIDGVEGSAYRQRFFKEFLEKEPEISWEGYGTYEPILTEKHLPKLFEQEGRIAPSARIAKSAEVDPSAVVGPGVRVGAGAVIGPGVVLEGKTVVKAGARIFGSRLKDTTVAGNAFVWGSQLEYTEVKSGSELILVSSKGTRRRYAVLGEAVRLTESRIEASRVGDRTEGTLALVRESSVGKDHLLEPYATIISNDQRDSVRGVNRGIGSRVDHTIGSGLFTDHHLAGRIRYVTAYPIEFYDEEGIHHTVPNSPNWGGGSAVYPELLGRIFLESNFISTDTLIGIPDPELVETFTKGGLNSRPIDTRFGFGSMVSKAVRMGEHLIHFTEKRGPGPENDVIGGVLRRPDVVMRHILSKTMSAAPNPFSVDKLMEAKIKEALRQARAELALVESGETHHPSYGYKLHSKKQLEEGIDLFEENLDGRWRMENHRFVGGFWLYDEDGQYSWNKIHEEGVQPAQQGGEITFASNIGRERDGQEDRVLVHTIPGWGDLLAVIDGHGGIQTADLVRRKLPLIFENALREKNGDIREAQRATFAALDDLVRNIDPGISLSMVGLPKMEKKAYPAWAGDSPIIIVGEDGSLFVSREHNSAFNEEERNAAVARGAFYNPNTKRVSRGYADRTALLLTRTLGDRKFRSILSQEPEIPEPILLGEKSVLLLASDGLVQDVRGTGVARVRELVQWMQLEFPAQLIVHRRLNDRDVNDNVSAIAYLPQVTPRSPDDIARYPSVYRAVPPRQEARDGAERYVRGGREWLMAHESLHTRPVSDALKAESIRLREAGDAKILIFHSSILREDMGESFSLALDHLAEETGNPLDNEQSVFKIVLLIDEPTVTFGEVDDYLKRRALRREQFYAVVTQDILEGYGDRETLRRYGREPSLVYRIKVGDFLSTNLSQERLRDRWGDDSNIVIVASEGESKEWTKYIMIKRFVIWKEKLKARLVVYQPRQGGEETALNLAPLLVTTAAEFVGTKEPEISLKDLKGLLIFIGSKLYVEPAPVEDPYFHAYAEYLNSV